jgi:predicted MPP superfamily phosphohydrolase
VIGQLKAPLGTYAVLGNHDWHTDGPGMRKALEDQGIPVLENESLRVNHQGHDFWIVGLADFQTRKPDYKKAVATIDTDAPRIVLSHDPYTFAAVDNDIAIQLSGHTHGGQVVFPFIGPVVKATQEAPLAWSYGLISHEQRQMIVSSGVGTSILPFKNTPNEIVQITLSNKGIAS